MEAAANSSPISNIITESTKSSPTVIKFNKTQTAFTMLATGALLGFATYKFSGSKEWAIAAGVLGIGIGHYVDAKNQVGWHW